MRGLLNKYVQNNHLYNSYKEISNPFLDNKKSPK